MDEEELEDISLSEITEKNNHEDFKGRGIGKYTMQGNIVEVDSWVNTFEKIAQTLYGKDPSIFKENYSYSDTSPGRSKWTSNHKLFQRSFITVSGKMHMDDVYVNGNNDIPELIKRIAKLVDLYGKESTYFPVKKENIVFHVKLK